MMVDQSRRKFSGWREMSFSLVTAVSLCAPNSQTGITKLSLLIFLASLLPFSKRLLVSERGIANARHLVGQGEMLVAHNGTQLIKQFELRGCVGYTIHKCSTTGNTNQWQ
jgi:hypothetical protein